MAADPRWLEVLKASGGQAAAVSSACGAFLLAARFNLMPTPEAWMTQGAVFGLVLFGGLALVSFLGAINNFFSLKRYILHRVRLHLQRKDAERYIPYMTEKEKIIIGYLLRYNQKTFTAAINGGHAATLISRGIIVTQMVGGQQASQMDVPMGTTDHIWEVLERHRNLFPHKPEMNRGTEVHPWRERIC